METDSDIPVVVVEFDRSLLGHFTTVPQWNAFVADLMARELIPPSYFPGQRPDPVAVMIDFSGLRRPHHNLDRIDLRMCWLEDADFSGASLRDARMCCGRNVRYAGARLHGADFREVEVSGCDFTGCSGLDAANFVGAVFDPANPPVGVPPEVLAVCEPEAEPPPTDPRQPRNPQEPTRFRQVPLRCHAIVLTIPKEL